ncbi:MAG: phage tail protein [Candidatus Binataceae bacterium]|nr:phage tail protein [Candidatus Binataceae bacterium]
MFAVLGEIVFEVLSSPEKLEYTRDWDYAELRVIEDRPRLQWIADNLALITIDLRFHASFTVPELQLAALIAAGDDHIARPLVFGNGIHRGYFVVTSLRTIATQMTAAGDLAGITVRTTLKEWALSIEIDPGAPPIALFPLLGVVAAPAGTSTALVSYPGAGGVAETLSALIPVYASPAIPAPGVSPILDNPAATGAGSPHLVANDVPPGTIVRAPR